MPMLPGQWLWMWLLLLLWTGHFPSICQSNASKKNADKVSVRWYAPFYSGGGYSSEAVAFVRCFEQIFANSSQKISRFEVAHHGDSYNDDFVENMLAQEKQVLKRFSPKRVEEPDVVICHSEPGAWHAPTPNYHTTQCPPNGARYKIGRTMFETNQIPSGWVTRLNFMDEIWVPTEFSKEIFANAGVETGKIMVVGEPVDIDFFAPVPAIENSMYKDVSRDLLSKSGTALSGIMDNLITKATTLFLFVGKWETRKGVDILLRAYQLAFRADDDVCLLIVTAAYHSTDKFNEEIRKLIEMNPSHDRFPCYFVTSKIPQSVMPILYSAVDVMVIPSHGEGWGRPHVEAMSCGTPIIASNWSGPTDFMNRENGYPLRIKGLIEAE
jgi:glycosyltransferase involved in cell wall biosynthesis